MTSSSPPPILSIENLSITLPNERILLEAANLRVAQGDFVLLVGPSGSGKSTLLKLIAGLRESDEDGIRVGGKVEVHGAGAGKSGANVGIVFQNLALFDELSAEENVQFSIDHAVNARAVDGGQAAEWLRRLQVPLGVPLAKLSGGERQRVALARTLARDPEMILFDEPTTGLDPARAKAVVELLVETHRTSQKTIVVVTHDFGPFLGVDPRLVLVDAEQKQLREVNQEELRTYFATNHASVKNVVQTTTPVVHGSRWASWIDAPGEVVISLILGLIIPFRAWSRPTWKLRYLWHYARMVMVGATSIYVALAGVMLGFVIITFTFKQLPYGQVTRPLLTEEFLAATGFSSFRVIVPLLVGLLVAGKCAAAIAADVGARRLTFQFEAMRSMRVRPADYLFGNIIPAMTAAGIVLTVITFAASTGAALIAYLLSVEEGTVAVFRRNYFATFWPITHAFPKGTLWVVAKSACTGFCVGTLSYLIGARPKESSVDVSRDVGRTIFWASLAVLLIHSVFSFVEF